MLTTMACDEMVRIISDYGDRIGRDMLLEFLDRYNMQCLAQATPWKLARFIREEGIPCAL